MRPVLVFGASYGSLFATKLLLAGIDVTLVAPAAHADEINRNGTRTIFPVRGRAAPVEVDSRRLPGKLHASAPAAVDPARYGLVVLAMQEPQYRAPEIRVLLAAVAAARRPCLSIMNMPPPPYLARIPGLATEPCRASYADAAAWDAIDPALLTHCSADAQASRVPGRADTVMHVRLPTNFRAARFVSDADTDMLRSVAARIDAARLETPEGPLALPVRLKVHDSPFVPLSKWPMLVTGNYRCIEAGGIRSIEAAVHADRTESAAIYDGVIELLRRLGADERDLVPFDAYATAADSLTVPSSAARAVESGATHIERVDRLVQAVAAQKDVKLPSLDALVAVVDARIAANRRRAGVMA
jgi:hypothetical protein